MHSLLIVDDEPLTREYLRKNIASIHESWALAGEAEDGQEALDFLAAHPVDLVITDIKMPVMDGLELCRIISQRYPQQKILILSGYDEFAYARQALLYGVSEYLLKPIVRENLRDALENIRQKIEQEQNNERVYNSLLSLSRDSGGHVIRKFLHALIHEANVELKTLFPLIHRMKISLMDGLGLIAILALDEESLLLNHLPLGDLPLYKYILYQAAIDALAQESGPADAPGACMGWVFLDAEENTCLFLSGDEPAVLFAACRRVGAQVETFLRTHNGLTLTSGVGSPVADLQQLSLSYKAARRLLLARLAVDLPETSEACPGQPGQEEDHPAPAAAVADALSAALARLQVGFLEGSEVNCQLALASLLELADCSSRPRFLRCGVAIIRALAPFNTENGPETVERAMHLLENAGRLPHTKESAQRAYYALAAVLSNEVLPHQTPPPKRDSYQPEQLINKVKAYIGAHFSEPISLPLIADQVGVSAGYLSQVFHKSTGESYIQYLTRVRMEQAVKLLRAYPEASIAQIAERVGYLGAKHFSYVFKQYYGMTPGTYRGTSEAPSL